jgi:hypothetical protein
MVTILCKGLLVNHEENYFINLHVCDLDSLVGSDASILLTFF